jgi:thioredoxin-dependent peroxiredoxin
LHQSYNTWVEKNMYGRKYMGTARVTFVIDERGIIEDIISKVDTKDHASQILKKDLTKSVKMVAEAKPAKRSASPKAAKKAAKKSAAKKKK